MKWWIVDKTPFYTKEHLLVMLLHSYDILIHSIRFDSVRLRRTRGCRVFQICEELLTRYNVMRNSNFPRILSEMINTTLKRYVVIKKIAYREHRFRPNELSRGLIDRIWETYLSAHSVPLQTLFWVPNAVKILNNHYNRKEKISRKLLPWEGISLSI